MRPNMRVSVWVLAGVVLAVPATWRVAAASGRHSAQAHQGMAGMSHGGMQPEISPIDRTMRDVNTMMDDLTPMMRDFRATHGAMTGHSHDQLMNAMQGMFDQMREFQGSMKATAAGPELMQSADASKPFQQAGRDFQQMGKSFQAMLKSMDRVMKGMHRDTGR